MSRNLDYMEQAYDGVMGGAFTCGFDKSGSEDLIYPQSVYHLAYGVFRVYA